MDSRPMLVRLTPRSGAPLLRSRTQGPVRFPPFEQVDGEAFQKITSFQIRAFGQIQQGCEHIPYNSTKRNFYEKTGRESIEAFKYEFRIPGQQVTYTVMWDYNIGLVRMTPFFKCLGYPKMLDMNKGLRGVSQYHRGLGYWVPYRCARAICATFCYDIAGALIPLFGASFPLDCTPPESPSFGTMVISHQLVLEAGMEAQASRQAYELRKEQAAQGVFYRQRLDPATLSRPLGAQDASSPRFDGLTPTSVPGTAMADRNSIDLPHMPTILSREASTEETGYSQLDYGNKLAPMNRLNGEYLVLRSIHDLNLADAPMQALVVPDMTVAPWANKRRRQDCANDACTCHAKAKTVRLGSLAVPRRGSECSSVNEPEGALDREDDFAAAAVLVDLHKETQDGTANHDKPNGRPRAER